MLVVTTILSRVSKTSDEIHLTLTSKLAGTSQEVFTDCHLDRREARLIKDRVISLQVFAWCRLLPVLVGYFGSCSVNVAVLYYVSCVCKTQDSLLYRNADYQKFVGHRSIALILMAYFDSFLTDEVDLSICRVQKVCTPWHWESPPTQGPLQI